MVPVAPAKPDRPTRGWCITIRSIQLLREPCEDESMAVATSATSNGHTIVGRPSRTAVTLIADHFGFDCEEIGWPSLTTSNLSARATEDYRAGWRTTFTCRRR